MTVKELVAYTHQGKRTFNEDSLYPNNSQINTKTEENFIFLVCDGVGGSKNGQIASQICCERIPQYLKNHKKEFFDNSAKTLTQSIRNVEQEINSLIQKNPTLEDMATTIAILIVLEENVFVGWIGDSRVYQIRNNKILTKTKDHSFVNLLIDNGVINEEEAKTHPKRNHILRAIQAGNTSAELDYLENIATKVGDFFFLCSDGVMEAINDNFLETSLGEHTDLEVVKDKIIEKCMKDSKDNFTFILLRIE